MKTITEEDYKLSAYIYGILRSQIHILFSWGFSDTQVIKNGIRFHVEGFILKGYVSIVYNCGSDYFDVSFQRDGSAEVETTTNVGIEQLVEVIDRKVERTPDYEERIRKKYGLN